MNADYEERVMEFEAARNEAMDKYFSARPQLMRTPRKRSCLKRDFGWYGR